MHTVPSAIQAVKAFKDAKFDESMDVRVHVGGQVSGAFTFPHGLGKSRRVVCFVEGPDAAAAAVAGAIEVGGAELAQKIATGKFKVDVVVAHPNMMRVVAPLGKILKSKMPSPRNGSLTTDVVKAVSEFYSGRTSYKSDKDGNLHTSFGRKSFGAADLVHNLCEFIQHLGEMVDVTKVSISATMSPSVEIKVP